MELLFIFIIFSVFISFGVCSVLFESRAAKKGANWGFHVVEKSVQNEHPIDAAYRTTNQVVTNDVVAIEPTLQQSDEVVPNLSVPEFDSGNIAEFEDFQVSEINSETKDSLMSLMNELQAEYNKGNDNSTVPAVDLEGIEQLIGPRVSNLITAIIPNLPTDEEVVTIGTYKDNQIIYNGFSIQTNDDIVCDPNEPIVVKGAMLPNGIFRVLVWEDAQTIEVGFAGEEFILPSKTA